MSTLVTKYNDIEKWCPKCERWKPHADFYKMKYGSHGLSFVCKPCYKEVNKDKHSKNYKKNKIEVLARNQKWRSENPEKYKSRPSNCKEARRKYRRKERYNLSPEDYNKKWEEQKGLCAISGCGRPIRDIDHDHETGEIRALLCSNCNRGLGLFKDDPVVLRGAAEYLEKYGVIRNGVCEHAINC